MFGYVRPPLGMMEEEQVAHFRQMYCGLCHTLKSRHGFWAQFILNYDFTFLAMVLSGADGAEPCQSRCLANPVKKQTYCPQSEALELAADQSVILAYWQLQDHVVDDGFFKATGYRIAGWLLKSAYRKAATYRPGFDAITRQQLDALHGLEVAQCPSIDEAADTFATLLAGAAAEMETPMDKRVLGQLLYHLGRWIYLIDGADDLAEDAKSGNYNPVALRYGLKDGQWTQEAKEDFANTLDHSIHMVATALELRKPTPWTSLLEATVYTGLFAVGNGVLEGTFEKPKRQRFSKQIPIKQVKQIENQKNVEEHQ